MSTKYQFIHAYSVNLTNEQDFRKLINTQGIFEEEFEIKRKTGSTSLQLRYDDNFLSQIKCIDEFNDEEIELNEGARKFRYFEQNKNRINFLIPSDNNSHSYLGEDTQEEFKVPIHESIKVPFQIIGKLSGKDQVFNWLPFEDFYITYPLFSSIADFLFLDYSNPVAPKLLGEYPNVEYPFGEMENNGVHKFQKTNLKVRSIKNLRKEEDLDFDYWYFGTTGVPSWIQHPEIPVCPIGGKTMKFIGQIRTNKSIKVKDSNLISNEPYFDEYANHLCFWGSGELYVFIEPESRIVGMLIQDS